MALPVALLPERRHALAPAPDRLEARPTLRAPGETATSLAAMALRFVIIGGGPAGTTAATHAARLGADVTLIERDIVGGAAHLWDCIPSKAMIATGGAMIVRPAHRGHGAHRVARRGRSRLAEVAHRRASSTAAARSSSTLLDSQGVRMIHGHGRLVGPHEVVVETPTATEEIEADAVLVSTGSRPRIPDWADARRRARAHDPRRATRRRSCPSTSS